jgi:betaine-aldehyde dehydrogenase
MKIRDQLYINGQWVSGATTFKVLNPADGEVLAEVASADASQVKAAIDSARKAFASGVWSNQLPKARAAVLRKAAEIIETRKEEFALIETLNTGKPIKESRFVDVASMIDTLDFYAGISDILDGKQMPVGDGMIDFTRREPLGVVGLITPWNFPGVLAIRKLAPALMAGNTAVVKPASLTPLTTLLLGEVFEEAGLPAGVLNIVTGSGGVVGDALMTHPAVRKVSFTGSAEVGAKVLSGCSGDLKGSCMELGGKSPAIVCRDADIEKAVDGVLFGAFLNQGECCCAATRLLVDKAIAKTFLKKFLKAVEKKIVLGLPHKEGTTMGPLISGDHLKQVAGYVDRAIKKGAKELFRGTIPASLPKKGNWYPAVVLGATPQMEVYRKEVFGPVLTVTEFDGVDELIAAGNDTEYGLAASIFTESLTTAERAIRELQAGTVWVNIHNFVFNNAPYGGMKHSGIGRECGVEGLLAYTEPKNVIIYAAEKGFKWY